MRWPPRASSGWARSRCTGSCGPLRSRPVLGSSQPPHARLTAEDASCHRFLPARVVGQSLPCGGDVEIAQLWTAEAAARDLRHGERDLSRKGCVALEMEHLRTAPDGDPQT